MIPHAAEEKSGIYFRSNKKHLPYTSGAVQYQDLRTFGAEQIYYGPAVALNYDLESKSF
jgi:hypothetical protein